MRNPLRFALGSFTVALLALMPSVVPVGGSIAPAEASSESLSPPPGSTAAPNSVTSVDPFVVAGYGASEPLLVSIGFLNAPVGTSFSIGSTSGITHDVGYGPGWTGLQRVSFTGTQANVNNALANISVTTGGSLANFSVRVMVTRKVENVFYNPLNDHFYEYVDGSVTGNKSVDDVSAAPQRFGRTGYLATVTSQDESNFIGTNVTTDQKIWVGGRWDGTKKWHWLGGPEADIKFWEANASGASGNAVTGVYANWCNGEPNGSSENGVVIRWGGVGDPGCWNDWATTNAGSGYIIEYDAEAVGVSYSGVLVQTTTLTVNYPITNQQAVPGNGDATVSWTAPAGGTVTGYTVTSSPGSFTCTTTETSCTVTGLTNGTSYSFQVEAAFSGSSATSVAQTGSVVPAGNPAQVANLVATAGAEEVTLAWDVPAANGSAITGYTVEYADNDSFTSATSLSVVGTSTTVESLTNGVRYYFRVSATNGVGTGTPSSVVSSTPATIADLYLEFDGVDDFGFYDGSLGSVQGKFTIEAWVMDTATTNGTHGIFRWGGAGNDRVFLQTVRTSSSNTLYIGINGQSSHVDTDIEFPQNEWVHVAVTRNDNAWSLYVNGHQATSGTRTPTSITDDLWVGKSDSGLSNFWKGHIDQLKVWDYPLSQLQIRASMNAWSEDEITGGLNLPDIVAQYDFNTVSSSTVVDMESDKDLVLNGAVAVDDFSDVAQESVVDGDRIVVFPRSYLTSYGGWTVPAAASTHEYLIVGGGGSGGRGQCGVHWGHGGGGAGVALGNGTGLSGVKAVTVGVGGLQGTAPCHSTSNSGQGTNGTGSVFNSITATGGSAGIYNQPTGGLSGTPTSGGSANAGGTASGSFAGCGSSRNYCLAGGGGGAGGAGDGRRGGQGLSSDITGAFVTYGSGGAGRNDLGFGFSASGGGGASNPSATTPGSGGSDASGTPFAALMTWGAGANGIVVVRYEVLAVPTITSHPENTTIQAGSNDTLSVTASPGGVTYQWQVSTNGGNTWTNVASATSASLSLSSVTTSMDNNQYRVVVTNSNGGGETTSVSSNAAILTVEDGVTVTGAFCDGSYTKNGLTVDAGHGTVFYIDTGQGQEIDAGYIAYIVESANARNDLWVEVTDFTGGVVSLANPDASTLPLGAITAGGSDTAFFMIKASGATSTAQSHIVNIYSQKPTIGTPRPIYSCGYTFVEVAETIKAAANKVQSITSTTASRIGSTMTITVQGDTGTIGQGNDIDGRMIWVTPAARSDWPTDALRLESTSITFYSNSNRSSVLSTHPDTLRVNTSTTPALSGTNRQYYTATYTFRIIGSAANVAPIIPIAMISSGTQVKHTDVGSLPTGGSSSVDVRSPGIDLTVTKSVGATTVVNSDGTTTMSYTITLTNGGADTLIIDEVVDTPDANLAIKPGTAKFNGSTINDPGVTGGTSLAFSGPLSLPANSTRLITYDMTVATCAVGSTYSFNNTAVAKTGSVVIGSGTATQSAVTIAGNCGEPQAVVTVVDVPVDPAVVTAGASVVTTSTATISGTLDPNGQSGLDVRFRYGTNSDMSSSTAVVLADTTFSDAPYGVSTDLTGLSPGTTYYYVLDVEDPDGGWISGTVKSFTTDPLPATVAVTTTSASSITTSSAVLNGSVDANGISGGAKVKVEWATDSSAGACTTRGTPQLTGFMQSEDGVGGTEDSLLTGTSAVPMSYSLTGLSANTAYCYRVIAYDGAGFASATTGSWVAFTSTAKTAQTISWSTSASPLAAGGTTTVAATATSALSVVYTSADTSICTVNSSTGVVTAVATSGTCSITATQAGDSTYYAAIPVTTTFAIVPPVVTPATLVSGTYQTSGYTQTLGATGGNGTYGTWAVSTGALPAGLSLNSSTGVISGTPTAAGVFTFSVTVVSNTVTSAPQAFTITIAKRVVAVTASSPSVVFGSAAPTISPAYSGFQGSDQATVGSSSNVAPTCTSTYVVGQNVGTTATTSCSGGINANYTFTYATGSVSVTKFPVTITAIDAAKQNIVSGSNTEVTADPTLRWTATSPLPAGQTMADVVPGGVSIVRASAGTALGVVATSSLPAGEQEASFVITPSGTAGSNYEVTYVTGTFTIQTPKEVPVLTVTNKTMTYGDSTTASSLIGGTAGNRAGGSVAGTVVYTYVDGDGTTQTLTSLSGLEAGTYLISVVFTPTDTATYYHDGSAPLTETIVLTVERKAITVTAADTKKLVGALDPSLTWSGSGYLGSDSDADLGPVTITRASGETEGSYVITTTGGDTPNYSVTHVPGAFYIYLPVITVTETAGVLTNRTVQADCRGMKPGASADFILITAGTPQTIATTTVAVDGTCPMSSTLDATVPQGVHSLKITSTDPLNGSVQKLQNIILLSDRIQVITNNPGGGSGGGGTSSGGAPPLVSTPLSLVTGLPGVRRPVVPGVVSGPTATQTPSASADVSPGPANRLVPILPGAPRSSGPGLPGGGSGTVDLGSGVVSADQPAAGSNGGSNGGSATSGEGVRSVRELAAERLGGFAPGVGTRIEVLGARTAARFVVTEANQVDSFTLIRAIQASIPVQSADFFALDDVRPAVAPQVPPVWVDEERAGIAEFFAASGLAAPVSVADLDTSEFEQWIQVTGSAQTYLPGSLVYLTLTSDPLVLASAEVARDGSVVVTGSIPMEWLNAGEHRVRLVGIRALDGVSVDEQGDVQLSNELMAEIQRFDLGTQSTIAVMGSNLTGGDHVALRVVPLVPDAPWWTLWFILLGFVVVVVARWRGVLKTRGRHLAGTLVVLASATPGVILGWLSTVTGVVWWALGLGIVASVLSWFAPQGKKARRAKD